MKGKAVLKVAAGIAILAATLYFVDAGKVVVTIASADPFLLAAAAAVTPLTMLLRFARWKTIVRLGGKDVGFWESTKIYMLGFFFGNLTPSKVGDLIKLRYLHREHGIPRGTAFSLSILDRIFDMMVVVALSMMSMPVIYGTGRLTDISIFVLVFLAAIMLLFSRRAFRRIFMAVMPRVSYLRRRAAASVNEDDDFFESIYKPFGEIRRRRKVMLSITALSLAVWLSVGAQVYIIFAALGVQASFISMLSLFCVASLVGLIPITIAGLGTREAAMAFLFSFIGVASETAISASLLEIVLGQLSVTIACGVLYITLRGREGAAGARMPRERPGPS